MSKPATKARRARKLFKKARRRQKVKQARLKASREAKRAERKALTTKAHRHTGEQSMEPNENVQQATGQGEGLSQETLQATTEGTNSEVEHQEAAINEGEEAAVEQSAEGTQAPAAINEPGSPIAASEPDDSE